MARKKIKFPGYILRDGKITKVTESDSDAIGCQMSNDDETSGYGSLVNKAVFNAIVEEYVRKQNILYEILRKVKNNETLSSEEREKLNELVEELKPENDIVSGVYGRETLLHLLSQPKCEGLRYVQCKFDGKTSIVLVAVDEHSKGRGVLEEGDIETFYYEVKGNNTSRQDIETRADLNTWKNKDANRSEGFDKYFFDPDA